MMDAAGDAVPGWLGIDASHFHFAVEIHVSALPTKIFGRYGQDAIEIVAWNEGFPDHAVKTGAAHVSSLALKPLRVAPSVQAQRATQQHASAIATLGNLVHAPPERLKRMYIVILWLTMVNQAASRAC